METALQPTASTAPGWVLGMGHGAARQGWGQTDRHHRMMLGEEGGLCTHCGTPIELSTCQSEKNGVGCPCAPSAAHGAPILRLQPVCTTPQPHHCSQ